MEASRLNIEKTISNKRALTGYSSISVVEHIQSLQEKYHKDINNLKERLLIEKEMNQKLKVEVELKLKQSLPQNNSIEEEIKPMLEDLLEQHIVNTKSILDLQNELKEQEFSYLHELEIKKQKKDLVKKRLQGALQYLKTLSLTHDDCEREQNK